MAHIVLRGLTWGHRRAIDPLRETLPGFGASHPGIEVVWDVQPLSGFEFEPVCSLARRYDLLVFDHPHVGAIAAEGCLVPLDDVVGPDDVFVGPSLASYRWDGHPWGAPIDTAGQVACYRPDVLAALGGDVPHTWNDVLALGARACARGQALAMAFKGVHSLMTFYSLCASRGAPCATEPARPFVDPSVGRHALETMRAIAALCPPAALDWNSIAVQDALADRDDLVYCPGVYGFAAYAEADREKPLRFARLPSSDGGPPVGSTIGGAGIGVSASSRHRPEALDYVRYLLDPATQRDFARHHGQPAHRDAWADPAIDRRFGGFFAATRATMEHAWIRPRYAGYLAFQARAGAMIEDHLRRRGDEARLLADLAALHARGASPG